MEIGAFNRSIKSSSKCDKSKKNTNLDHTVVPAVCTINLLK